MDCSCESEFQENCKRIDEQIEKLAAGELEENVKKSQLFQLCNDLLCLDRYLDSERSRIPKFVLQKNQSILKEYRSRIEKLQQNRKSTETKFKFSSRNKFQVKKNSEIATDELDCVVKSTVREFPIVGDVVSSTGEKVLENLSEKREELFGVWSSLRLCNISQCVILCGPVQSSVFVTDCNHSTLVVACQQLRVHSSSHLDLYVFVSGKVIIEGCSNIRIAPYNLEYADLNRDFQLSRLKLDVNNWRSVDDFDWLFTEKPSPNWSLIPENERRQNWFDCEHNL